MGLISTHYYLQKSNNKDPKEVIIDEVTGQSMPLMLLSLNLDASSIVIAFLSFRFFDILKIYPINKAEDLPGSIGVMLDDIVAGFYSVIVTIIYINII